MYSKSSHQDPQLILFQLKAFWKRKVLTWHRNVISIGTRRISVGMAFHSLGAAAKKAFCLQAIPLTSLRNGSFKRAPWLDLNCWVGSYGDPSGIQGPSRLGVYMSKQAL